MDVILGAGGIAVQPGIARGTWRYIPGRDALIVSFSRRSGPTREWSLNIKLSEMTGTAAASGPSLRDTDTTTCHSGLGASPSAE